MIQSKWNHQFLVSVIWYLCSCLNRWRQKNKGILSVSWVGESHPTGRGRWVFHFILSQSGTESVQTEDIPETSMCELHFETVQLKQNLTSAFPQWNKHKRTDMVLLAGSSERRGIFKLYCSKWLWFKICWLYENQSTTWWSVLWPGTLKAVLLLCP